MLARAEQIGPHTTAFAQALFARLGRPGQRAIYGLANLPRTYARVDIEAVCERLHAAGCHSYAAVKQALVRRAAAPPEPTSALTQAGPDNRPVTEYQTFWEQHATDARTKEPTGMLTYTGTLQ